MPCQYSVLISLLNTRLAYNARQKSDNKLSIFKHAEISKRGGKTRDNVKMPGKLEGPEKWLLNNT